MKTVIITTILVIFSLSSQLFAGNPSHPLVSSKNVTFTGVVVDSQSGEALAGAQVEVEGSGVKTFTNLDGKFSLTVEAPSAHILKVKYISYEEISIKNLTVQAASKELQIKLKSK